MPFSAPSVLSPPSVPRKVYLETTTRCNLRCRMCLKYAQGSCIEEGDLEMALFRHLLPSLRHTHFLVLNGLGEPLLHPHLALMIAQAREVMPAQGQIGFQSNGLLLDAAMADRLLKAGLDTVCLSLDSLEPMQGGEHQFSPVERAISCLHHASRTHQRPVSIGIEVVLRRTTVQELPRIIEWAAERGVDSIIASHLFSFDGCMQEEGLFTPCSAEAAALYSKWSTIAQAQGLNMADFQTVPIKFKKSEADWQLLSLGKAMHREARERNISLHLPNLLQPVAADGDDIEELWQQAAALAQQRSIRLSLPPLRAPVDDRRTCPFMEEQAVFIASNGDVMPCHFLWHTYACMVNQTSVQVQARAFGNIDETPLEQIWRQANYAAFRAEAAGSDYAPCWNCSSGPCPDLVNANILDIHDCFGNQVPCGHCMWSLGWTRCL